MLSPCNASEPIALSNKRAPGEEVEDAPSKPHRTLPCEQAIKPSHNKSISYNFRMSDFGTEVSLPDSPTDSEADIDQMSTQSDNYRSWVTLRRNGVIFDQRGLNITAEVRSVIDKHIRKERNSAPLGDEDPGQDQGAP
ncbi:hypothetical protein QQS21_007948 [Conoideocrella luteorostrata]|uniref:Uncharacterized protein n=1 Tax=Conoideocrella luteorostrata TaxID=1105319 RepID=A0AAJ0CKM3_9HYPO|nr:hypothetical protein QQS21_007948 [Conoideocrella luteorostrata]